MKISLNTQILFGAVLGILFGLGLQGIGTETPAHSSILYLASLIAGIFMGSLKMILIPLVFLSITTGVANLQAHARMKRVWTYTFFYFLFTSSIALLLGLSLVNFFKPGIGVHLDLLQKATAATNAVTMNPNEFFQTLVTSLLANPISAMAKGDVVPTITFALIFGIALAALGDRAKNIRQIFNELLAVIMMIVSWIMVLAPWGIMALLIKLISEQNLQLLSPVMKFIGVVVTATLTHGLIILPLILWIMTRTNPLVFFKAMRESLITAFSTSSSAATMPITLRCLTENLKADRRIAGFVVPLGTTLNMDGTAMYEAIAAIFIANLVGIELSFIQQIIVFLTAMLASIGAPGIPSAGMVTMIMVLQSVGLPAEAVAILLPIDRPLDAIRTAINVEGDAVGTLIVEKYSTSQNTEV